MTVEGEREVDTDATVRMPRPRPDESVEQDDDTFDPEKTVVQEDWESTVIRRVAPRVAAMQSQAAEDPAGEERFGWESGALRRLSRQLARNGTEP